MEIKKTIDELNKSEYIPYRGIHVKQSNWVSFLLIPFWILLVVSAFFPPAFYVAFIVFIIMIFGQLKA